MTCVTKLARAEGTAVYGIRVLNHLLTQQLTEALQPHALTLAQLGILADLQRIPGVSSAALARVRSLTPQTVSEIINGLEKDGLLERRSHGGRILRVYLTDKGAVRLANGLRAARLIEHRMLAGLTPKERDQLRDLIYKCVAPMIEGRAENAS